MLKGIRTRVRDFIIDHKTNPGLAVNCKRVKLTTGDLKYVNLHQSSGENLDFHGKEEFGMCAVNQIPSEWPLGVPAAEFQSLASVEQGSNSQISCLRRIKHR